MTDHIRKRVGERDHPEPLPAERMGAYSGTVADLLDWCFQRAVELEDVTFTGSAHLSYPSIETADECASRLASVKAAKERQERWERETFERLAAKFAESASVRSQGEK